MLLRQKKKGKVRIIYTLLTMFIVPFFYHYLPETALPYLPDMQFIYIQQNSGQSVINLLLF